MPSAVMDYTHLRLVEGTTYIYLGMQIIIRKVTLILAIPTIFLQDKTTRFLPVLETLLLQITRYLEFNDHRQKREIESIW